LVKETTREHQTEREAKREYTGIREWSFNNHLRDGSGGGGGIEDAGKSVC